jgi:predicted Zn-ribbon and HTH transcriptional regulator
MSSYSIENVVAKKDMARFDPYQAAPQRAMVFQVQCRMCSYEPEDVLHPPRVCPKCHSQSWERFARPGSILQNANRYAG